jgi:hypothetical protein
MMALPFGNISLFNTSYSLDIRPGPVIKRLTSMAINNDSNSYPPTNPSGSFTSPLTFVVVGGICGSGNCWRAK